MEKSSKPFTRRFELDRSGSPWNGYTASYAQEQAGMRAAAADFSAPGLALDFPDRLAPFARGGKPLLGIDRSACTVFVNGAFFSDLERPDATMAGVDYRCSMGRVLDAALAADAETLFAFLVESHLVKCIAHTDAILGMSAVIDDGERLYADFSGEHHYYTSRRESSRLAFRIVVEKAGGLLSVEGLA